MTPAAPGSRTKPTLTLVASTDGAAPPPSAEVPAEPVPPPPDTVSEAVRAVESPAAAPSAQAAEAVPEAVDSLPRKDLPEAPPTAPAPTSEAALFAAADRAAAAMTARATLGLSPAALGLAYLDWIAHLAAAPGKQAELILKAWRKSLRLGTYLVQTSLDRETAPCIAPLPGDERFSDRVWKDWPFRLWSQGFLLTQQWWHNATTGVPGVSPHNEALVSFASRQMLDMLSPSNAPWSNPQVLRRVRETGGLNFAMGARNFLEDQQRKAAGQPPVGAEAFVPGETVAVTPGEVVYRNHLIEVIQYRATTPGVHAEPVLLVPAWIMKYYILDLSPKNSLVKYLVSRGHTVFCISWRNVTAEDRDLGFEDYRRQGFLAALEAVRRVIPERRVHAVGYCLGGTLLAIAAAAMARAGDDRLASVTLFAAQTDFSEAGELQLFVDPSELNMLESMMWDQGTLTAEQMAGAFQMLRSNDLVWSRMVHDYLMGERTPMSDLMAWNADATRLPARMHSEYLRKLFLNNDLAAGRYVADGHPVSLQNIRVPLFVVGTERDHVAPWRSVYKIINLTDTDVTFVLASGGHNAGIVSEPGHPHRHYRHRRTPANALFLGADEWLETTPQSEGSWWPAWSDWLAAHSAPGLYTLPPLGLPGEDLLGPAPGTYVMQR